MATVISKPTLVGAIQGGEEPNKKNPVDEAFEKVDAGIQQTLDGLAAHPEEGDHHVEVSAQEKIKLLQEIAGQVNIPATPKAVEEAAVGVIARAMTVGVLDAGLVLVLQKFPKLPEEPAGKTSGEKSLSEELREALNEALAGFKEAAQAAGKEVLQQTSTQMKEITKILVDAAKLMPIGGDQVPVEAYQAALAGMVAGAYTAGLLDTGVAFLDRFQKASAAA